MRVLSNRNASCPRESWDEVIRFLIFKTAPAFLSISVIECAIRRIIADRPGINIRIILINLVVANRHLLQHFNCQIADRLHAAPPVLSVPFSLVGVIAEILDADLVDEFDHISRHFVMGRGHTCGAGFFPRCFVSNAERGSMLTTASNANFTILFKTTAFLLHTG